MNYKKTIDKLNNEKTLTSDEYLELIRMPHEASHSETEYLFELAQAAQQQVFGNGIYTRGLIELTNYCKNDCYYCGIRKSNSNLQRYRLTKEEILECCHIGNKLGFRTFVIQGGEDPYFSANISGTSNTTGTSNTSSTSVDRIEDLIRSIKDAYPDNAITLSLGENSKDVYQRWFDAGADRYLLRHETATDSHYAKLHPATMLLSERQECLYSLKQIGYQAGTGFMVGSPYQTDEDLVRDLIFIEKLKPEMVGIGPFISHKDTEFAKLENGSVDKTLVLIAILRLMNPKLMLPATTALGSASEDGRERGILAGANVVMPNITPKRLRKLYSIYDGKINTGADTAEGMELLSERIEKIGYELLKVRGDYKET